MTKLRTHYDNLKVARDAPDFVIRAAYKTLSQKYHPDKNPDDARATRVMALINQSYEVLSDPQRRAEHDAWIAREEAKLRAQAQAPPQSPPIPPQWQQPEPPGTDARTSRHWMSTLLLLPFKLIAAALNFSPKLAGIGLLLGGMWLWNAMTPDRPPPPGPKPYQAVAPVGPEPAPAAVKPAYVRPATAPNGSAWPDRAGYVKGYPIGNASGRSEVTVDNAQNDADVFVKLVSLEGETAYPVRQFYIRAGAEFTMNKVSPGQYDLRYLDLESGGMTRSESFEVTERRMEAGIEYSSLTMTLYKVQDGNFQTYPLSASEF
jgi:hypothetical protein